MSIEETKHSLFGASKVAADVLVQQYGRYFGMKTACFRAGCITGPNHSGAQLHGFLSYRMKCASTSTPYQIFGYKGKQVRDNIHSSDPVNAFDHFFRNPGGARFMTSAARASAIVPSWKRSPSAKRLRATSYTGLTQRQTVWGTTSGGSAMSLNVAGIILNGIFTMICGAFRCRFLRTARRGGSERAGRACD